MYTILVASDVYSAKVNLEFSFAGPPPLPELQRQVEAGYAVEAEERRPPQAPPGFRVTRFQLYDEGSQRWHDVTQSAQLFDYCQLYAFQPPGPWHREIQAPIPAPIRARVPPAGGGALAPAYATPTPRRGMYGDAPYPEPGSLRRGAPASAAARGGSAAPSAPAPRDAAGAHSVGGDAGAAGAVGHDEKVAQTFNELDANGNRVLEPDEWRQGMRAVRVIGEHTVGEHVIGPQLSDETADDLFGKADLNQDGVIQFAEWQRFMELYPTLLDTLYFRFQAYWQDRRAEEEGRALQEQLAGLRDRQQAAEKAWNDAKDVSEAQKTQLQRQEEALADAQQLQREKETAAREAAKDVDQQQKAVGRAEGELRLKKEMERQMAVRAADAARDTAAGERRFTDADAELARAEDCKRQTEQLLEETKNETERQKLLKDAAAEELDTSEKLRKEAQQDRDVAIGNIGEADAELKRSDDAVKDEQSNVRAKELDHTAAVNTTQKMSQARQEQERVLLEKRDQEAELGLRHLSAKTARADQEELWQELRRQNNDFNEKRKAMEDQERPLVEQEVRLRQQRDALENNEGEHRAAHRGFYESAWRGGGDQASPRRDREPSPAATSGW